MPVYKLLEMPYDEMLGWFEFFEKRPIGWRDDLRTSYLLQAQGVKEKPTKLFPSLAAISKKSDGNSMADSLKNSALFLKMKAAVGGDKLDIL